MNFIKSGINSIFVVTLIIAIGFYGLIRVEIQPLFFLIRSALLAGLGSSTPGLRIEGDIQPAVCDYESEPVVCTRAN